VFVARAGGVEQARSAPIVDDRTEARLKGAKTHDRAARVGHGKTSPCEARSSWRQRWVAHVALGSCGRADHDGIRALEPRDVGK